MKAELISELMQAGITILAIIGVAIFFAIIMIVWLFLEFILTVDTSSRELNPDIKRVEPEEYDLTLYSDYDDEDNVIFRR